MLADARAIVDIERQSEVVRTHVSRIEQAAQQRILGPCDRVQRTGAVEPISKAHILETAGAASAKLDFKPIVGVARSSDAPGNDLQPPFTDQPGNGLGNFRRDAMAVNVPPWPSVPQEATLLAMIE